MDKRNILIKEADMQLKALKKIRLWFYAAVLVSTLGAALTYAGITINGWLAIPGVFIIILGLFSAAVINLGIRNGRRNVEKIKQAAGI